MPPATTPITDSPHAAFARGPGALHADAELVLALGNCQAESLRLVLPERLTTVRIPPVHELGPADLPVLQAWLARADAVVVQPIADDYHGLPLGTRQLIAAARPGVRVAVVPVIRFAGLYPRHLIVRPPSDTSLVPPVVAYHDAAVLAEAAGLRMPRLTPAAVHAVAEASLDELRRRERRHGTVLASDLFAAPRFELMRTINHPGNAVWAALGRRVLDRLGVDEPVHDPGRPLLDSVHAPRSPAVIEAFGLEQPSPDEPGHQSGHEEWIVDGRVIASETVRRAHLHWYAEHPDAVRAGLDRHAATLSALGVAA